MYLLGFLLSQMVLLIAAIVAYGEMDLGDFFAFNLLSSPLCLTSGVIGFWTSSSAAVRNLGEYFMFLCHS